MAKYLATQIKKGALNYDDVIEKYPQLQDTIDDILRAEGILGQFKK